MPKSSAIPISLRQSGLFCCWRSEEKNGRKTKIPYNPTTGQRAQTNNPKTFTDFQTALRAVKQYNGLGFLIPDGMFTIDIDNGRAEDDSLKKHAAEIVAMFEDCYTEWTPSNNGLHILGRADGFSFDKSLYWMNNRQLGVEVYHAAGGCVVDRATSAHVRR